MKNTKFILLLVIAGLFTACNSKEQADTKQGPKTNENQEHLLAATLWQQTSAEASALNYQNYRLAKLMLDKNISEASTKKPLAIITDLDETVIDNSAFNSRMIKYNKSYSPELWAEWVKDEKASLLSGALDFFKYADSKKVNIFYLSNRSDSLKNYTLSNLKKLGLPQVTEKNVMLKSKSSNKTERRNSIFKDYEVILYLGDNLRDFSEIFGKRGSDFGKLKVDSLKAEFGSKYIVFANPMYGEWEKPLVKNHKSTAAEKRQQLIDALDVKK